MSKVNYTGIPILSGGKPEELVVLMVVTLLQDDGINAYCSNGMHIPDFGNVSGGRAAELN